MYRYGIRAKRRLEKASVTKALAKKLVVEGAKEIASMSNTSRKQLSNAWVRTFGGKDTFNYNTEKEISSVLQSKDPSTLARFLVENKVLAKNSSLVSQFKEKAFVAKQKSTDASKINDLILSLTQKANPALSGNEVVVDWLVENGFDCPVVNGVLVLDNDTKRKLNSFIVKIAKDFNTRAPNAPYTTYYPATSKDYDDALKIIGFNPSALDIRSIRIGQALSSLANGKIAIFNIDDVDEVGLNLMFTKMHVPVNIEQSSDGIEVTVTGLFPQSKELSDHLEDKLKAINEIKLLFPSTPITQDTSLATLINTIGSENIQRMNVPRTTWAKLYPEFIEAYNSVSAGEDNDADKALLKDVIKALHMDTKIEGLQKELMYQLMNDGAIMLIDKPSLAQPVAEILNNLGIKAKVDSSKFGTLVKFDSKKAYNHFYD